MTREPLLPALLACAAIDDPVLRRARLSEFQTDRATRDPRLATLAAELCDGVALGSGKPSVLDGNGFSHPLPTLSVSRPRLDDAEPEKLLGRKTQRVKGGTP